MEIKNKRDKTLSLEELMEIANAGDVEAIEQVGDRFYETDRIGDIKTSVEWYEKGAAYGEYICLLDKIVYLLVGFGNVFRIRQLRCHLSAACQDTVQT